MVLSAVQYLLLLAVCVGAAWLVGAPWGDGVALWIVVCMIVVI